MDNSKIFTSRGSLFTPRCVLTEVIPTVQYRLKDNDDFSVDSSSMRAVTANAHLNSRPDQSRVSFQLEQNSTSSIEANSPRI